LLGESKKRFLISAKNSEAAGEKPSSSGPSVAAPGDQYDERSAELMDVLAMLYFVVEVFRSDETFGDELSECKKRDIANDSGYLSSITGDTVPNGCEHEGQAAEGIPR
jgi:hypothetical protein